VRGRLYHGRRRLRRALRPLADSVLTAERSRREERAVDPVAHVGRRSRFEVGIAGEHSDELGKQFAQRTDQAVRELEALLAPGSA
jgi:hypothetical protein